MPHNEKIMRFLQCKLTPQDEHLLFNHLAEKMKLRLETHTIEVNGINAKVSALRTPNHKIALAYIIPQAGPLQDKPELMSELNREQYQAFLRQIGTVAPKAYQLVFALNLLSCEEIRKLESDIMVKPVEAPAQRNKQRLMFHSHVDFATYKCVNQYLALQSLQQFYLELPRAVLLPAFELFNRSGDYELLLRILNYTELSFPTINPYIVEICRICFANNIRVLPVDQVFALDQSHDAHRLITIRDSFIIKSICEFQARDNYSGPFSGLFGALHFGVAKRLKTHAEFIYSDACQDISSLLETYRSQFDSIIPIQTTSLSSLACKIGMFAVPILAAASYYVAQSLSYEHTS